MSLIRLALGCALAVAAVPAANLPSPTSVARDARGFLYLAGTAYTNHLPTTPGVLQPTAPAGCRADTFRPFCTPFLVKLAPDGSIVWATYFSGNGADQIAKIALAPNGDLVIAGSSTSTNLLPNRQGYRTAPASLFLARLTSDGASIVASTYFGGTRPDTIGSLALDAAGNVYVAGIALSVPFPTTPGAYRTSATPDLEPGNYDGFLAKFDGALHQLLLSTLTGPTPYFARTPFTIGADGSLYVAVTGPPGVFSSYRITVTRLAADGSKAIYSTTFTSFTYAMAGAVVSDDAGNAYVAAFQSRAGIIRAPGSDIVKFSPSGDPVWTTSLRNANIDSMVLDGRSELVFTGIAVDPLFVPTGGAPVACTDTIGSVLGTTYVARFNILSRSLTYAGYLNAAHAWLTGDPQFLVAESAFVGLPQFATLPASLPSPGTVTCVANAASHDNGSTAPGEILAIDGVGIGPDKPLTAQLDTDGNVARSLGGITVTFDGTPAPILNASNDRINLVAPFSLSSKTVRIELRRSGTLLAAFDRAVTATHAGFFTANGLRSGPLAALNQDGTVNSASDPATPGSIVSIFATGLGAMTPAAIDGSIAQGPLSSPIAPFSFAITMTLSDPVIPEIDYLGNAPGMVQGAIQINFRLPRLSPPAGIVTVGSYTNSGQIWVR